MSHRTVLVVQTAAAVAAGIVLYSLLKREKTLDNGLKPANDIVALLGSRPERTGTWFIVHESVLASIEYEEVVDIYVEFFERHPNGSEAAKGIVAVKLNGPRGEHGPLS